MERDFTWENLPDTIDISTHTLTWSVTLHLLRLNCKNLHFNSHAHVERDISADVKTVNNFISTHTLTWSVTDGSIVACEKMKISTHTLTWSVTH